MSKQGQPQPHVHSKARIAWSQAPYWGEKGEKNGRYFSHLTLFFLPFALTAEPGTRLRLGQGQISPQVYIDTLAKGFMVCSSFSVLSFKSH